MHKNLPRKHRIYVSWRNALFVANNARLTVLPNQNTHQTLHRVISIIFVQYENLSIDNVSCKTSIFGIEKHLFQNFYFLFKQFFVIYLFSVETMISTKYQSSVGTMFLEQLFFLYKQYFLKTSIFCIDNVFRKTSIFSLDNVFWQTCLFSLDNVFWQTSIFCIYSVFW